MATITRNSAGNWKAIIRKKGWPTTSKTFKRKRDAEDWARRVEDEMVRGVYIDRAPSERLTIREAVSRYLSEVSPTKSRGAVDRETSTSKPLLEHLGDYSLAATTPKLLSEYRDKRLATKNRFGRMMSPNQVRLELALLSHLFTVAIQEWGVGLMSNPVASIRKPKLPEGRDKRLSSEEEARLLAECRKHSNPMLYWIVKLAIESCMRRGEILGLRRDQVNLDERLICLKAGQTKTGTARNIPLSQDAVSVLRQAMHGHVRAIDSDLVFWGEARDKGGQRKPYDFTEAWEAARKAAGLSDLRFHDLRHEAISRLVEGGLEDSVVSEISGHKTAQMLKRYTHLRGKELVAKLDAIKKS